MNPMEKPVEQTSFRTHFLVLSLVLVALTVWALVDEFILRRPWKGYQRTFKKIEHQKVSADYQKFLRDVYDVKRLDQLKGQQRAEEGRLEQSKEYREALTALKKADVTLSDWVNRRRAVKSEYDEAAYEFTHARMKKSSRMEFYRKEMAEQKKVLDEVTAKAAEAQSIRDTTKKTVDQHRMAWITLKAEIDKWELPKLDFEERLVKIKSRPIQIQQVMVPALGRIDRCLSCHVGIEKKGFGAERDLVHRSHPGNEFPLDHPKNLLAHHPVDKFGCAVCHHGDGESTKVKKAHGYESNGERVEHFSEPMIKKEFIQAACAKCHEQTTKPGMEIVQKGKDAFKKFGCLACHKVTNGWGEKIAGWEGGPVSVDLAEIADKAHDEIDFSFVEAPHTWAEYVRQRLLDPQKVNPSRPEQGIPYDSPMPNHHLSKDEAVAITTLLQAFTREVKKIPESYKVKNGKSADPAASGDLQAGRHVFVKYGCGACHGLNGEGGQINYNYEGGPTKEKAMMPHLQGLADKYTDDELVERIELGTQPEGKFDANDVTPPLFMPRWKGVIKPEEFNVLVKYLKSIKGAKKTSDDW